MSPEAVPQLHGVDGISLAMAMTETHQLQVGEGEKAVIVQLPPQARGIFPLIDGRATVADVAARLETRGVNAEQFETVWRATVKALAPFGLLALTAPSP
ncbi:hypothetical protein GOB81_08325 [Acetobacter sp. LMG 1627]|uniref:Uncharacterized protein n=2 Tax=Acetobacter conturbans TaxID=1737472 RepID=A0ABX0JZ13_9PROT|nr:hypothetical protein [Acetobacter conturbans]